MSTAPTSSPVRSSGQPARPLGPMAAATAAAALAFTAFGTYVDTPYKAAGTRRWGWAENHSLIELPFLVAFAALGAAVVFGVLVRRGLRLPAEKIPARALALALVGGLTVLVFWTGLPVVFAAGAAVLAVEARSRLGRTPPAAAVALALAVVITGLAAWAALAG